MTEEEFEAQLQWAMNYADSYGGRATVTLDFLREVEKRNAKLAAVPVDDILKVRGEGIDEDWQEYQDAADALGRIDVWLERQLQP